jgi:hypothetical protein
MLMRNFARAAAAVVLCVAAQDVGAERLIAQFSGEANRNTGSFEVRAPWIMDWLVSGEPGQYEVVDIALVNADTGAFEGVAVRSKTAGNGVRLFDQSGRFYFRVDASMMGWKIKVIQLTAEEAEQYKPKAGSSVLDR